MNKTYEMEETLKNTYGEETVANDLAPDETSAPTTVAAEAPAPNIPTSAGKKPVPPMPAKAPVLPGVTNESLVGKGNSPQEVRNAKGELVGHVSNFGGYNRFTSTDGNKVFWTNSKGEQVEAPKSMQMMDAMNAGLSPNRGFRGGDWDQALKEVQAQGGIDAIRAQQYKRAAYDTLTLKERKKKQAEYNFTTADAVARAWTQVKNGYGDVKQSKDGNFYRIVKFSSSDGYGPVADANKQMADTGRKSRLRGLIVAIRTDKDGRPIDPATGKVIDNMEKVNPIIKMQIEPTGGINGKSPLEVKDLDLGRVMNQHAASFAAMNDVSEDEARNNTYSLFGKNPLGWKVTETNKMTPELQKAYMEVALKEKELKEKARQFDAKLSSDEKIKFAELGNNKAIALTNAYEKMINSGGNAQEFLKALPESFVKSYFGGKVVMENGVPKEDADGNIVMMPLSEEENMNRFKALLNVTQKALTAMGYKSIPIMSMGNLVGGFPQAQNQGGASTAQSETSKTPAERAAAVKAEREAAKKVAAAIANNANTGSADGKSEVNAKEQSTPVSGQSSSSTPASPSVVKPGWTTMQDAKNYLDTSGVSTLVSLMNNNKGNNKGTSSKPDLDSMAKSYREAERRARSGQETYAARKNGTLEKPVKETSYADTRLIEIPGKAALDVAKGARWVGGKLVDSVTGVVKAIGDSERKALKEAGEKAGEDRRILQEDILGIANATPRDAVNAIRTTADSVGYLAGEGVKAAQREAKKLVEQNKSNANAQVENVKLQAGKVKAHASALANRIKGNLAKMDVAAKASTNDPKTKDRNAFYANRDGRSGKSISPLRWINEKLDVFRKDNSYKDKKLVNLAKEVAGEGKEHTLAVIREVMKADGIDTSEIYPGMKAGDAIFEKIYKLSATPERPKLRNPSKDKKVIVDPSRR